MGLVVCRACSSTQRETQTVCGFDIPESVDQARETDVDHSLAAPSGAKVLSKLDVMSGFWLIPFTAARHRGLTKPDIRPYWQETQYLSLAGELLLKGQRMVIHGCLRDTGRSPPRHSSVVC